jgi:hypothetical protein
MVHEPAMPTSPLNAQRVSKMKKQLVICIAFGLTLSLSSTVAFARGGASGMGMSHMTGAAQVGAGGSFGTSPFTPGTNSAGTALSSSGIGRPMRGPLLGTGPAVDQEETKVDKALGSICRGC